jgi:beta-N-acetylhexosaminidase
VAAICMLLSTAAVAQVPADAAKAWADSVYKTLSEDERIAQLMVVRLSEKTPNGVLYYDKKVGELVKQYNIGGVCLFQGGPVWQAGAVNRLQAMAKTPIMMCIDGEWGLGMRFDSVTSLNKQMMLGAVQDPAIIYQYGRLVGEQCKRAGIQVNYAPVVDVNNNPNNPVINDRSFGEDKYKVAQYGIQYMKGMQDVGVMACAKHFPGHGDVAVDSHYDLPVINKARPGLDSLELYPFREIFKAGVGSVMIAHLYIPAIDNTANRATSISKRNVTELMRNELGYQGLSFTDALEMQGVRKFFPAGEASAESLIAGNDMLCLPGDVAQSIAKIRAAIKKKKLTWTDIEIRCKKVLLAKYQYGLHQWKPLSLDNITADLNKGIAEMKKTVAENALTLLRKEDADFFPLVANASMAAKEVAYVGIGISSDNAFARRMRSTYKADVYYFNYKQDAGRILSMVELLKKRYKKVVIGIHAFARVPANNFSLSKPAITLATQLQQQTPCITFVFGNPYSIKNFCGARNLVVCYEDDEITQEAAADMLEGKLLPKGKLPVTVCEQFTFGSGIAMATTGFFLPRTNPDEVGLDLVELTKIDSIAQDAIAKGATPGCVVMVVKNGKIAYFKPFGRPTYDGAERVTLETVYDMASVTKTCATTLAIMKLYEEGKIDLKATLGDYLPWVRGSNKQGLTLENILLHQAGLVPFIPFYKETIAADGRPLPGFYSPVPNDSFGVRVAKDMYLRTAWRDTLYQRILQSPLGRAGQYVYSDNDFIFLGKIAEAVSGLPLDEYVSRTFYRPLGLTATGFRPEQYAPLARVAPTEQEKLFRLQLLRGDVHDPGAALFGGVAGHAGLFSDAYGMAVVMQMLLNGGTFNNRRYLQKATIDRFNAYYSKDSRRGLGFDKPERDNDTRKDPYPCRSASPLTFGHTGFTGTCAWADPANDLVFIFLSNRVHPEGDNRKLLNMNIRPKIHEAIYQAMQL